jgi:predicted DNA-binding transcriptional regulator AlpA
MDKATINRNLLKAQMALRAVSNKELADAQGWSLTTVYRKINGKAAFTAPEMQICVNLLGLNSETASEIFFAAKVS